MRYRNFIFITNTEWANESPRCRHQMAIECSKIGKVYFIEKHYQENTLNTFSNIKFFKTPKATIPRKLQFFLPLLKISEDKKLNLLIQEIICLNNLSSHDTLIVNFRYDYCRFNNIDIDHIYICNDEFTNRYKWPIKSLLNKLERNTAKNSKACFAISNTLKEKLLKYNKKTYLFKPGITIYESLNSKKSTSTMPNKIIKICYGGYINDRLDFNIIESLLRFSNISIEVFGPVHGKDTKIKIDYLKTLGLIVTGPKNFKDFIDYLSGFDLLIAPYKITSSTSASSMPNKILQYLQTGRPVIISKLPNLDLSLKDHITIANKEDWGELINQTLNAETKKKRDLRLEFSKKHTWEKSLNSILEVVKSLN